MMRLVALRLRSDLDSHSRTVTEGLTFQKIGKLVGMLRYIFMWSIFMCFIGVGEASAGQSSRYRTSNTTAAYTKV